MTTEEKIHFPKVLICAPQHETKNYCFESWVNNVKNFTYPNYDVFLADNSETKENSKYIQSFGFKSEHTPKNTKGLLFTINDSHNACREYAIDNGYEWMLHLETDVIPPIDVIERLLAHNCKVVGGLYDIFHGKSRKLMVQQDDGYHRYIKAFRSQNFIERSEPTFFDGTLKRVYHAGIGCMLIHREVFSQIKFRVVKGNNSHSDTWFANDCFQRNIPIYVDTAIQCKHLNSTWLTVVDDLKEMANTIS